MRLIDADALKKTVFNNFDNLQAYFPKDFIEEIDNAPTVEPTFGVFKSICCEDCDKNERPQGKWLQFLKGHYSGVKCSLCDTIMDFTTNYCPKCGAYMKE